MFFKNKKLSVDGFAESKDIKSLYQYDEGSLYLGDIHPDHNVKQQAGIKDDQGFFVMAGSRSGKGTSFIIPNLLEWKGGIFCIDPKGENASITAIRRGTKEKARNSGSSVKNYLNKNVAILDPFNTVKGPAKCYKVKFNPLKDIDINSDEATSDIFSIAESIVIQDESSGGQHFTETVETLLCGVIEAVLHNENDNPENVNLPYCLELLQTGGENLEAYLARCDTPSGLASEALSILFEAGDDEKGSFRTTFSRQMRFMQDPRMKDHLGHSEFSLSHAVQNNWSIYVCIPPNKIRRAKRWLRMITNMALDAKMNQGFSQEGDMSLFILDEFAALGNMGMIEEASGYMATYGIKLIPIIQNIGQVKKHYPKNWETFLSNAGAIIAWGLNDLESEKYIADRMGSMWVDEENQSISVSSDGQTDKSASRTKSISKQQRAIRWPNEIHYQGARDNFLGFVISAKSAPFMIKRIPYFEGYSKANYDHPKDINTWESKRG